MDDTETTNGTEPIERISVTATIEVGTDTATVSVKRVDEEGLSTESHEIQTVMMLATGKALNEMVAEIFDQGNEEEVDDVER